jgi:hypothetical protein
MSLTFWPYDLFAVALVAGLTNRSLQIKRNEIQNEMLDKHSFTKF